MTVVGHRINGKIEVEDNSRLGDVYNPATGEVELQVALASVIIAPVIGDKFPKNVSLFRSSFWCWRPNNPERLPSSLKSNIPV